METQPQLERSSIGEAVVGPGVSGLVSILFTCYNHLAFIQEAWQSILDQTYEHWEVIALDDGSTDGTREWLASLSHPQLKVVFNEKNLGTYGTLNRGLSEAKGEFIAVFNDDDLWAPEKLASQIDLLKDRPDVGLVHTNGHFIDGKGQKIEGEPLGFKFPRTETGDLLLDLVYANKIIASAVLARRECFAKGGFDTSFFGSGDWDMWLRIATDWKVGFIDKPQTFYRVHGGNASHKLKRIWEDDYRLRSRLIETLNELGNISPSRFEKADLKAAVAHNLACVGTVACLTGHSSAGRSAYGKSIAVNPKRVQNYARWLLTFMPQSWWEKDTLKRNTQGLKDA